MKEKYYLQIADNALILSHRLAEYCSRAPFIEEDLANTNISLDLIGLAESVYEELAKEDQSITGDFYAYKRTENDFVNCLLFEQGNDDYAMIIVRQFLADNFHFYFFSELTKSEDEFLKALALKSLKEVTYHLRRSSEWMIRLGDGTPIANEKMQKALNLLWNYHFELFTKSQADLWAQENNVGPNLDLIKLQFEQKCNEVFYIAKLNKPKDGFPILGGKKGIHSEKFGHMLSEMQFLTSKYPDAIW